VADALWDSPATPAQHWAGPGSFTALEEGEGPEEEVGSAKEGLGSTSGGTLNYLPGSPTRRWGADRGRLILGRIPLMRLVMPRAQCVEGFSRHSTARRAWRAPLRDAGGRSVDPGRCFAGGSGRCSKDLREAEEVSFRLWLHGGPHPGPVGECEAKLSVASVNYGLARGASSVVGGCQWIAEKGAFCSGTGGPGVDRGAGAPRIEEAEPDGGASGGFVQSEPTPQFVITRHPAGGVESCARANGPEPKGRHLRGLGFATGEG